MDYLVDASVVVELVIAGPYSANAYAFFRGAFKGDRFTVPELCLSEATNVIWQAVRLRGMPAAQASQALRDLKALPLRRAPSKAVLSTALALGLRHNLAIYDSLYLALAKRSQANFVTLDQKQAKAALAEGIKLIPLSQFT